MNIIDYVYPLTTTLDHTVASSQTTGWESHTHTPNDMQSETLTIQFTMPIPLTHLGFTVKGCANGLLQVTGLTEEEETIPLTTTIADTCETMITSTLTSYTMTITTPTPVHSIQFTFTPITATEAYTWELQNLMINSTLTDTHPLDYEGLETVDSQQNQNTLHVTSMTPQSHNMYWISGLSDESTRSQFLTLPLPTYPVAGITLNPLYEGQQINCYYNPNPINQLTWDYTSHENICNLNSIVQDGQQATGVVGSATFTLPPLSQLPLTLTMTTLLTTQYPECTLTLDGTPYALAITSNGISLENTIEETMIAYLTFSDPLVLDNNDDQQLTITLNLTTDTLTLTSTARKLAANNTVISTRNLGTLHQSIPSAFTILTQGTTLENTSISIPTAEDTIYLQLARPEAVTRLGTINNQTITNPLTLIGNDNNSIGYSSEEINPFMPTAPSMLITTLTTIPFTGPANNHSYTFSCTLMGNLPTGENSMFTITDTITGDTLPLQLEATQSMETDGQYWTEYTATIQFPEHYQNHQLTLTITPTNPLTISMLRLWNTTDPQPLIPLPDVSSPLIPLESNIHYQLLTLTSNPQLTQLAAHITHATSLTLTEGILHNLTLTNENTQLFTYNSTRSLTQYTNAGIIPSPLTPWEPLALNHTLTTQTISFPYVCHGGTLLLEFTQLTPVTLSTDTLIHTLQNLDTHQPTNTDNSTTAATLTETEKTYYQHPSDLTDPLISISNNNTTHNTNPLIPPHHIHQHSEISNSITNIHHLPHTGENTGYHIVNGQTLDHTLLLPGHQQTVSMTDTRMLLNNLQPFTNGKSNHVTSSMTTSKHFHLQQTVNSTRNHTAYHTGLLSLTWKPINTLINNHLNLTGSMLHIQTPHTLTYQEKTLTHGGEKNPGIATITLTSLHPFRTLNFSNYSGTTGNTIILPLHETPVLTQTYWQQHPTLNSQWETGTVTWSSPTIAWGTSSPHLDSTINFIPQNVTRQPAKALNCQNIQTLQLPSVTITHPVEQIHALLHYQLLTQNLTTGPLLTLTFTNNGTIIQTTTRINPHVYTPTDLQFPAISLSKGTWTLTLSSSTPLNFLIYTATLHTSSISIMLNSTPNSTNGIWYNVTSSIMHNQSYTLPTPVTTIQLRFILNNGESFTSATITPNSDTGYSMLPAATADDYILRINPQPPTRLPINTTILLQPEALNLMSSETTVINPLACMWESTDPTVITVNQYGFISGLQAGTAQIRVHWLNNMWESNMITVED